jgi:glutamyl-tRNA synthetase
MHIGNFRTALFEYLIPKKAGGVFILRIEDTDRQRYVEGTEEVIYETLRITGLNYDEGPGIGGEYGPYIQSERKIGYLPHALELVKKGRAYFCFCTKERLETLEDERGLKKYDRHCLNFCPSRTEVLLTEGTPYVIRQLIPEGSTTFHDEVFGSITIENKEMEDQVLIKSDGMPTYNFANVVDDHAMAITHVVRGSEYITSTPKYKLLYEALEWDIPAFVHLPLLQNEAGAKISKRHADASSASITDMVADGFLPDAIVNYAALLGWSPGGEREIFTLAELTRVFDTTQISKSPATFDIKKLTWVNGEHIKALPFEKYREMALPYLKKSVRTPGIDYDCLARLTQPRVSFVKECAGLVDFIDALPEYDIGLYTHKKMKTDPKIALQGLRAALDAFAPIDKWDGETLQEAAAQAAEAKGLAKGQILWPVRTALSGKPSTPCGATEIAVLLGKTESLIRLEAGIKKLEAHGDA